IQKYYYMMLFLIPFSFMITTTFYAKVVFMPVIIIFSIKGLIYIKELLSKLSKSLETTFPLIFLSVLFISIILRLNIFSNINFLDLIVFFSIPFILILLCFLVNNYNNFNFSGISLNLNKLKKGIWIFGLTISILVFSTIILETDRAARVENPYPWKNTYLTGEELKIIDFFKNQDIGGLIFVFNRFISERLGGVGFLPTFSSSTLIGIPLYYNLISPNEVYKNTEFSWMKLDRLNFFNYTGSDPINFIRNSIRNLDLRVKTDFDTFMSFKIQYIISSNNTSLADGINNWILVQSINESNYVYSNKPIFETEHLLVYRIF
ncbi:MAG: hypothetical protein P8Y97_14820, partial [Candidatus Lokiarchaeota archaeon]